MKSEWKDISSFSQQDKERIPKSFERRCGVFRLVVTRNIHYQKDQWIAFCQGVFSEQEMHSKNLAEAQCQASAMLQSKLWEAIREIAGIKE